MGMKRRGEAGVTLTEILIAGLLLSLVFLASASTYVTALKFFNSMTERADRGFAFFAVDHIARRASLSNRMIVNDAGVTPAATGKQLKLRWDYDQTGAPLGTPQDYSDDTWVKYAILEGPAGTWRLYFRTDTAVSGAATDVATTDTLVESRLRLDSTAHFEAETPSGTGLSTVLDIRMDALSGQSAQPFTVDTDVLVGAYPKN